MVKGWGEKGVVKGWGEKVVVKGWGEQGVVKGGGARLHGDERLEEREEGATSESDREVAARLHRPRGLVHHNLREPRCDLVGDLDLV